MNDHLISLYIDNELTLQEKIDFIDEVANDTEFYKASQVLLRQELTVESVLRQYSSADTVVKPQRSFTKGSIFQLPSVTMAFGFVFACFLVALIVIWHPLSSSVTIEETHRFVLYLPDAGEASVIGSFSHWSPIPMEKIGNSGYWTLNMKLAPGEYRYSYLIEQHTRMFDPTVPDREIDDFGGENSIVIIGTQI